MTKKIFFIIISLYVSLSFAQDSLVIKKFAKSYLREGQHFHFNIPSFRGDFSYGEISIKPNDDIKDDEGLPPGDGGGDSGDHKELTFLRNSSKLLLA